MATCLASELTPLAALRKPPRVVKISKVLARAAYSPRSCSSSRLLSTANKPSDGITAHHRALTLAHKTRALLPQALPSNGTETHLAGLPEFWDDVLRSAQSRSLSSQGPTAPARVVSECEELKYYNTCANLRNSPWCRPTIWDPGFNYSLAGFTFDL